MLSASMRCIGATRAIPLGMPADSTASGDPAGLNVSRRAARAGSRAMSASLQCGELPRASIRGAPTWQAVFVRVPLIADSLVSGKSARAVNVRVEGRFVFDDIAAISGRLDGLLSPKVA